MANVIKPVTAQKNYELVCSRIIEMIESGEYREGSLLPSEAELADRFQLGRSSIREAIKSLQLTGIVTSSAGKGTSVAEQAQASIHHLRLGELLQDTTKLSELAEARLIIEPEMAKLAAQRRRDRDLAAMAESIEKMHHSNEKKELLSYGHDFHRAVCEASYNEVLIGMHNSISMQILRMREMDSLTLEVYRRGIGDHQEILNAIIARDSDLAAELMRKHLWTDYRKYLDVLWDK